MESLASLAFYLDRGEHESAPWKDIEARLTDRPDRDSGKLAGYEAWPEEDPENLPKRHRNRGWRFSWILGSLTASSPKVSSQIPLIPPTGLLNLRDFHVAVLGPDGLPLPKLAWHIEHEIERLSSLA